MKNRFGKRYITDKEFLDYAWDTGLFTDHPSRGFLQFLEARGILNPVARIRFPPECVRRWYLERYPSEIASGPVEGDTPRLQAASDLYNLVFNNVWQDAHGSGEGAHPLDEIAPDHAPFIQTVFTPQSFVPWDQFQIAIALRDGEEIHDGGTYSRTLYHYWQIFPLASFMRSGVTILYDLADEALARDLWELNISKDVRQGSYRKFNLEARHELKRINDHTRLFEAVAYFQACSHNALQRYFHNVDRLTGRLPYQLDRQYRARERQIARETLTRFSLQPAEILDFVKVQAELWCAVEHRSPPKVAAEYKRNIDTTIDLYRHVSRKKTDTIISEVGRAGGYFKPILKVIFPDWLEEQRAVAERSLRRWIVPSTALLPPPYAVSEQDVSDFCDWLEQHGLYQLYWHFKRLLDLGLSDAPITETAVASEVVSYANTAELLANAILEDRGHPPRGKTLGPKVKLIITARDPMLLQRFQRFIGLTDTRNSTLNRRLAQIDLIKQGGALAVVLRVLLKLIVIRNEGSHLGLQDLDRKAMYQLLEALVQATFFMWALRQL